MTVNRDALWDWLTTNATDAICVCGRLIPPNAVMYGFPLSPESDEPMAFISEWHDHCLGEFGWVRDGSEELGIRHVRAFCP